MRRKKETESGLGFVAAIILGVLFMPIVGIKMMGSKKPVVAGLGFVLTILGFAVWVKLVMGG